LLPFFVGAHHSVRVKNQKTLPSYLYSPGLFLLLQKSDILYFPSHKLGIGGEREGFTRRKRAAWGKRLVRRNRLVCKECISRQLISK
jgi:hypothetical protein